MIASKNTQSLTDFRLKASETLDRLNRTGEAEIITVNGEARAVLVSPALFDKMAREAELSRDVATMRRAVGELGSGEGQEAGEFFDQLRAELLGGKNAKRKAGKRGR